MPFAQNTEKYKKKLIGAMNMKQACVWIGVLGAVTQIFLYSLVSFFLHVLCSY
jgi:hypothetical protein